METLLLTVSIPAPILLSFFNKETLQTCKHVCVYKTVTNHTKCSRIQQPPPDYHAHIEIVSTTSRHSAIFTLVLFSPGTVCCVRRREESDGYAEQHY